MSTSELLTLLISLLLLIPVVRFTFRRIAAYRQHRELIDSRAGCYEQIGFMGCSVVCVGLYNLSRIQELLSVEYSRYELILVVDSLSYPDAAGQIISHYKLVRVNNAVENSRALYRSSRRAFRRLVLLDVKNISLYDNLNYALDVASYDYILPIGPSLSLYPYAIEALAIAVVTDESRVRALKLDDRLSCFIFHRDSVISSGGFNEHIIYQPLFCDCRTLDTPIVYRCGNQRSYTVANYLIIIVMAITVGLIAIFGNWRIAMYIGLFFSTVLSLIIYYNYLLNRGICSKMTLLCYFFHIISFFYRRKFHLS